MSDKEQPIKLLFTIDATETIVDIFAFKSDSKMIIASQNGKGFIANTNLLLSTTKKGRQVFNLDDNDKLICIKPADGDTVAVIGNNRRLLIFPAQQIPVMARGKGVKLQRYKDKQVLSDVRMFELERGLTWHDTAGRAFNKSKKELELWLGNRGQVGKPAPHGFPRGNKFSG